MTIAAVAGSAFLGKEFIKNPSDDTFDNVDGTSDNMDGKVSGEQLFYVLIV